MSLKLLPIPQVLQKCVPHGRIVTFEELAFLRGGLGGLGVASISSSLKKITDNEIPWWRVVGSGALTGPVKDFLQSSRTAAQAERLRAEGVSLDQPLKAREEVWRYSDVQKDVPYHPLSHLVQAQVLDPIGTHIRSLIWLHGRDSTALRYGSCLPSLWEEHRAKGTKILLPNSPLQRDVDGKLGFCWLRSGKDNPDIGDVEAVAKDIVDLIDAEGSQIGPQNVCVGGYSQGAMLAIHVVETLGVRNVCGAIAINGWRLPCTATNQASKEKLPKLLSFNGDSDIVVDPICARASFAGLNGSTVAYIDHPTKGVKHAIKPGDEKQVIAKAMAELFPNA